MAPLSFPRPIFLRTEGLPTPLAIDQTCPHFSWQLAPRRERNLRQSAYQIQLFQTVRKCAAYWDSGRILSFSSQSIAYAGPLLEPRTRYSWRARVWSTDQRCSSWSSPSWFETGLLDEPWSAKWIGLRRPTISDAGPALEFWRFFTLDSAPAQARLYITTRGVFRISLNGQTISTDQLTPGWTDYRHRLDYLTYDLGPFLKAGSNLLHVTVGDGWWSAFLSEPQFKLRYGRDPSLLAQLILVDAQGHQTRIVTDSNWSVSAKGPILENSLYHGETFDGRRIKLLQRWQHASRKKSASPNYQPAKVLAPVLLKLVAKPCPPIRPIEELPAISFQEPHSGHFIFDFGQNVVGWVRLKIRAPRGRLIRLRFGEMLHPDGTLYTENLRGARATDVYYCHGDSEEVWEPQTTFHGFRYVELTGSPATIETLRAIVVSSLLPSPNAPDLDISPSWAAGAFSCSDPLINSLHRAIVRSQKGNFLDLPSDCPQRDERLGWSGDAQIFAPTASFNSACTPLFASWMRSMRDGQRPDGAFPDLAPHLLLGHGNAGWGDAGIIVPWVAWRFSGQTRILEDNFNAMVRHLQFMEKTSHDLIRPATLFGDWLAVDAVRPESAPTPKDLIGTAYFAHCAALLSEIASAIGKTSDASRFKRMFVSIRRAFQREFVTRSGRVVGHTQTGYLLALGFDLLGENLRSAATAHLVELLEQRDWHLSTGFLGTPLLAPVLSACGQTPIAYRLLLQKTSPSWLYPILQGATTMWERWDSWTQERGFGEVGMNSFNHYAYGAIGQWLYSTVAGIWPLAPGFSQVRIAPEPGGNLRWARAKVNSAHGAIVCAWQRTRTSFTLNLELPPNTRASVHLPVSSDSEITEGGQAIRPATPTEPTVFDLGSGKYQFHCRSIS